MDFFNTDLAKFGWKIIATLGFVGLMILLIKNAAASLKRTGSWKSVIDEIVVGLIVVVGYGIAVATPLPTIVEFVSPPLIFVGNLIVGFLRQLGFPI